jgi:hypothetical protein
MIVSPEIYENVARGAAFFDNYFGHPSWRRKCTGFEFHSLENCILGMLFGSYGEGCRKLGWDRDRVANYYGCDISHDFSNGDEYPQYQQAWEDEFANPPLGTDDDE